jgi:butyrate kinase
MGYNILAINPGSTSTDMGYYKDGEKVFEETIRHDAKILKPYLGKNVTTQLEFRKPLVLKVLEDHKVNLKEIDAVIGRGGMMKPVPGGIYEVNEAMLRDLYEGVSGQHAGSMGGILAHDIAQLVPCKSFIADPIVTIEMCELAKYTGVPGVYRRSRFHALNQKRVAKLTAAKIGKKYEDCRFVVAHLGGGSSIGAHENGIIFDVTEGYGGEGPFTPQRCGAIPGFELLDLCFSGDFTKTDIAVKMHGNGGLLAHLGTADVKEIVHFIETGEKVDDSSITATREKAQEVVDAMIYQIVKEIGSMAGVIGGALDGVIITGGLAYSKYISDKVQKKTAWLGRFFSYPGGDEKAALKEAAQAALKDPSIVKQY